MKLDIESGEVLFERASLDDVEPGGKLVVPSSVLRGSYAEQIMVQRQFYLSTQDKPVQVTIPQMHGIISTPTLWTGVSKETTSSLYVMLA